MKKKLFVIVATVVCMSALLLGCAGTVKENESTGPNYVDEDFIVAMGKGLEKRWALNDEDEAKKGYDQIAFNTEEYKEMMKKYINAELEEIEQYKDELFENSNLQELAIKYINLLNKHKEICEYMTVDYNKYQQEFQPIYDGRSKVIQELVENYNLSVSEKYQTTLDDFLTNAKLVIENESKEAAIKQMLGTVQFEVVEENGNYKTYHGIVENTTGMDFKTFNVSINLMNADGVIVNTAYDAVSDFKANAKVQFEFSTDKEFTSTTITASWYE